MPILLALAGPTAVGKTELSLEIARAFNAEIICVDSRQIYKDFSVGTAKPSIEARKRIVHHLTDFLSPNEKYSAGNFLKDVHRIVDSRVKENFILVGGTGLYLQALAEGLPEIPEISAEVKEKVQSLEASEGLFACFQHAKRLDPELITQILPSDKSRILRILEVALQTGKPLSEWQKERKLGFGPIPTFLLTRSRENLYERIDARVKLMLKSGWPEEVSALEKIYPPSAPAWNSLGYLSVQKMLRGEISLREASEQIARDTRHFAKRQLTWFRNKTVAQNISAEFGLETAKKIIENSRENF